MSNTVQQRVIDANLVNALKLFVSKDENRPALNGIHFTQDDAGKPIAVATDGRRLACVDQLTVDADTLPAFPNGGYPADTGESITVPVKPIVDALRKVAKKATLPVLQTPPLIAAKAEKDEPPQICIPVTDLEAHSIDTVKAIEAVFPNYRHVIPSDEATMLEVMFDAEIVLDIAKAALDFAKNGKNKVAIKLCIGDNPGAPLRVEVRDESKRRTTMVAMPMREPGLINRIGSSGFQTAMTELTQRMETALAGIEALLSAKKRKGQEASSDTGAAISQAA